MIRIAKSYILSYLFVADHAWCSRGWRAWFTSLAFSLFTSCCLTPGRSVLQVVLELLHCASLRCNCAWVCYYCAWEVKWLTDNKTTCVGSHSASLQLSFILLRTQFEECSGVGRLSGLDVYWTWRAERKPRADCEDLQCTSVTLRLLSLTTNPLMNIEQAEDTNNVCVLLSLIHRNCAGSPFTLMRVLVRCSCCRVRIVYTPFCLINSLVCWEGRGSLYLYSSIKLVAPSTAFSLNRTSCESSKWHTK